MSAEMTANRTFLASSFSIFSKEYLDAHSDWPMYSAPNTDIISYLEKGTVGACVYENLNCVIPYWDLFMVLSHFIFIYLIILCFPL